MPASMAGLVAVVFLVAAVPAAVVVGLAAFPVVFAVAAAVFVSDSVARAAAARTRENARGEKHQTDGCNHQQCDSHLNLPGPYYTKAKGWLSSAGRGTLDA